MNLLHGDPVEPLSEEESWAFLESQEFARLAFAIAGEPDIVPINIYARDRIVYFRTAEGSKLLGITVNANVALEADAIAGDQATSVIVHGTARELERDSEYDYADSLPLRSWVPTLKYHYVAITCEEITGRRFHLGEPQE